MSDNGSLRTDDLALAVLLIMNDQRYTLERGVREVRGYHRPYCTWRFSNTQKALELRRAYEATQAAVEPNRFVRVWGVVRREMQDFLNIN